MPNQVISDATHAVSADEVQVVAKSDDLHPLPIPSFWYLDVQSGGGYRRLTFGTVQARDAFYTALVTAMS